MYLSSTEESTKFTKDKAVQTIILAGSYLGAMLIAGVKLRVFDASPVNPAIYLMIFLVHIWGNNFGEVARTLWIFGGASFVGSVLSLLFFRLIYKKA